MMMSLNHCLRNCKGFAVEAVDKRAARGKTKRMIYPAGAELQRGATKGLGTKCKVTDEKEPSSDNFKNSLAKAYTPSDLLAARAPNEGDETDGSEAELEVTVKNGPKIIDFKDSLVKAYAYPNFLAVKDQDENGGSRGPEPSRADVKAAATKGTRGVWTSKMVLVSFETKSPGSPLHSTEVPEMSLMHVSATYEEGESKGRAERAWNKGGGSDGPEAGHELTVKKYPKTYPGLPAARYNIENSLAESARDKGGRSEGSETEHETTNKKDLKTDDFKNLLMRTYPCPDLLAARDRNEDSWTRGTENVSATEKAKEPATEVHLAPTGAEEGESKGPEIEHEATSMKDLRTIDFGDLKIIKLRVSPAKAYTPSDFLVERARNKGGGSDGPEAGHELTVKKDPKTINFKDSLAKTSTYPGLMEARNDIENSLAKVYVHLDVSPGQGR